VDDLRKAVARDPEFSAAEAKLAEAYFVKYIQTKDSTWLAQADAAESSASRNGQTSQTRYVQAMIWQATGETDKAVSSFRQILQAEPANVDVWNRLANTLKAAGRIKEAEDTFKTAVRLRPGYWPIYNDMGTFYLDQNDYAKAEQSLRTGITLAPDVPNLHSNLGALYFNMSRWDDAAREFEKSVALKPYALGYSNLGTVRFFQGKYAEAARQFEDATRLQPANYVNWGNLGDARWQLAGQRDAARAAFEKAALLASQRLVLNPGDARVRSSYALYLAKVGRFGEAKTEIEAAITRSPEDMNVRFNAARVYAVTGDSTRTLAALGKARALGYEAQEIEREPDFNSIRHDPRYRELQPGKK
jgi:tetratricopeptide (TPR) repeat protein